MKDNKPPIFVERPPDDLVPPGEHCTYWNIGCPDDLCWLPYGHAGGHILGTMRWDTPPQERIRRRAGDCLPKGATIDEVMHFAWVEQKKRWPNG